MKRFLFAALLFSVSGVAHAVVTSETFHGTQGDLSDLPFAPSSIDLIHGALPSSSTGVGTQSGFRTDPPATLGDDQFPSYTDGAGVLASGLTGLLADNEPPVNGQVVQSVTYELGGARLDEVRVFTGNTSGDARQFSTFVLGVSTDGGASFAPLGANGGYFQSDATNTAPVAGEISTLQRVFDTSGPLATGVDFLQIDFYASGNNSPQRAVDPFDGVNPFTGADDGQFTANQSPLVWEVDVIGVPEPSSLLLLGSLATACGAARRRRSA